jgi:hypothetical protein
MPFTIDTGHKPGAAVWLHRIAMHPEKYGTSAEHLKRVDKRVRDILAGEVKAAAKRESVEVVTDE